MDNLELTLCYRKDSGQLKVLFVWWTWGKELKGIHTFFFLFQSEPKDLQKYSKAVILLMNPVMKIVTCLLRKMNAPIYTDPKCFVKT